MFKEKFGSFVCQGDTIRCEVDGLECVATLWHDDDNTPPDERQEGYWPSLDPKDNGYIGPKSKRTLARHMAKAKAVLRAWQNDEWHYFGVAITVFKAGVQLTDRYEHALWGCDGNYPCSRRGNDYLREVANELLGEALEAAKAKLTKLAA